MMAAITATDFLLMFPPQYDFVVPSSILAWDGRSWSSPATSRTEIIVWKSRTHYREAGSKLWCVGITDKRSVAHSPAPAAGVYFVLCTILKGERFVMATYLMFGKYSPEALKSMSAKRTTEAKALIKKNGGELKAAYAVLGDVDLVMIVDLPDTARAMAASAALAKATGIGFTTAPAVSVEEFDRLVA